MIRKDGLKGNGTSKGLEHGIFMGLEKAQVIRVSLENVGSEREMGTDDIRPYGYGEKIGMRELIRRLSQFSTMVLNIVWLRLG